MTATYSNAACFIQLARPFASNPGDTPFRLFVALIEGMLNDDALF